MAREREQLQDIDDFLGEPTQPRPRSRRTTTVAGVTVVLLTAAFVLVPGMISAGSGPTTFSGRAYGMFVESCTGDRTVFDTGALGQNGGSIDAGSGDVATCVANGSVMESVTSGADQQADSQATVTDVLLFALTDHRMTADFVQATSHADCRGAWANGEVDNLVIMGESITVTGAANQVVDGPGFHVVLNEQVDDSSGGTFSITVNALHAVLTNSNLIVIVGSAHSDITCGTQKSKTMDFVTGGGFILVDGAHANFGFVAGYRPGNGLTGELNYIDHGTGMHVKATSVDFYGGSGTQRTFGGTATIDGGGSYTYTCTVQDNGEPGVGVDWFHIDLSNGYVAEGFLAGGNIQLHVFK